MAEITIIVPDDNTCNDCDKFVLRVASYDTLPYCTLWEMWLAHNDKETYKSPECMEKIGTLIEGFYKPTM